MKTLHPMRLVAFILFFCLAGAGFSASEACPLPKETKSSGNVPACMRNIVRRQPGGYTAGEGTYYTNGNTYPFVGSTSSGSLTPYNVVAGTNNQAEIDNYQSSSWTVVSYSGPSSYSFSTVGAYCLFTIPQGGSLILSVFDTTNSTTYYVEFVSN